MLIEHIISEARRGQAQISDQRIWGLIIKGIKMCEQAGYQIDTDNLEWGSDNSTSSLGTTAYSSKNGTPTVITISKYTFDAPDDELLNTILHELAHYITFKMAMDNGVIWYNQSTGNLQGRRGEYNKWLGHGMKWKQVASKLSSISHLDIQRTGDTSSEKFKDAEQSKIKYIIKCKKCGSTWQYEKKTKVVQGCYNGTARCHCGSNEFEFLKGGDLLP